MNELSSPPLAVSLTGIVKRFRRVVANDNINLEIPVGETFALVGENGAGKTTLMNVLSGYFPPDAGEMLIAGKRVKFRSPSDAIDMGVGMVHQHFMLVAPFTAMQNIVLGHEPVGIAGTLKLSKSRNRITGLMQKYNLSVPLDVPVSVLGVGEQQRVEILKALYRDTKILILDEPTAVLTPQEVDSLFEVLKVIKEAGTTIIFITHKLQEVMIIADRIGVMRNGKLIDVLKSEDADTQLLAELMVGRAVEWQRRLDQPESADIAIRVKDISVTRRGRGRIPLHNISFDVKKGEIFGVAGVLGNGQRELEQVLTGALKPDSGEVHFHGQRLDSFTPARFLSLGIAHIPESRQLQGLVVDFSVRENLILGRQREKQFNRLGILRKPTINAFSRKSVKEFDVRPPLPEMPAANFSGGNQQKVVAAREMLRDATCLVAAHPTRGVDIGAMNFIHKRMLAMRANGVSLILISADLSELLRLCDRIGVIYKGRLVEIKPSEELDERDLGVLMTGGTLS